ncbi:MAG: hypothetical protein AAB320_11070 [Elusimicrobiota bacterium]
MLKSLTAAALSSLLILTSPGLASYQAFAADIIVPRIQTQGAGPVIPALSNVGGSASFSGMQTAQFGSMGLQPSLQLTGGAPAVLPTAAVDAAASVGQPLSPSASLIKAEALPQSAQAHSAALTPQARIALETGRMAAEASASIQAVGELSKAAPAASLTLGQRLDALITGKTSAASTLGSETAPVASFGAFHSQRGNGTLSFAKPAGDSIREAAEDMADSVPAPKDSKPSAPKDDDAGKGPFWPKLVAAGIALLPAVFIAWPMIAAGTLLTGGVAGGLIAAASLTLALMPFLGDRSPKFLRTLPGNALFALGLFAFMSGNSVLAGGLALIGGWGLTRFGRGEDKQRSIEKIETLGVYFGALGAITGVGLALLSPAGWLATGLTWASYPLAMLLWMQLPRWIAGGIETIVTKGFIGVRGVYRVTASLRTDTVLYERLVKYSTKQLEKSRWNAVWLSAIWMPVLLGEAVQFVLAIAAGTVLGVVESPIMFAWGSFHEVRERNGLTKRATVFFAEWARGTFQFLQGSKAALFNPLEKLLIPYADSTTTAVSIAGAAAIRVLQLGWVAFTLLAAVPTAGFMFLRAAFRGGAAYDPSRHSPGSLKLGKDDVEGGSPLPDEPADPSKPVKNPLAPKIIATLIGLLPLGLLALPAAAGIAALDTILLTLATLGVAAMPLMPATTSKRLRQAPAAAITAIGIGLLLTGQPWMGAVAALGGWGLLRYTGNGGPDGRSRYSVNDPAYIGAFFGAVVVTAGIGVALLGPLGWVPLALKIAATALSPLLLVHLPRWVGQGAKAALTGPIASARAFYKLLSFWENDTKFYDNLKSHSDYWLKKTFWNGTWLSLIWVPTWALQLTEGVASLVLGAAYGILRAPFRFVWGALDEVSPQGRATRFMAAAMRQWSSLTDGSKKTFDAVIAKLIPTIDEKTSVTGRPTLKAALAMLAARLVQAVWLAWTVAAATLALPVVLFTSALAGMKAAAEPVDEKQSNRPDAY